MSRKTNLAVAAKTDNLNRDHQKIAEELRALAFDKELPNALPLEEAVLGAAMLDKKAFAEIKALLEPKHFYKKANKEIYTSIVKLTEAQAPVDILTVTDNLKKRKKLDAAGGPHYLVGLTNRVASAANIAYHAKIVIQKYLSREGILNATQYLKKLYNEDGDVFDLRNKLSDRMRVIPPQSFFTSGNMKNAIKEGADAPALLPMIGGLWNRGEVAFFYGPSGTGKSVGTMQMADAISKGVDFIPDILPNECGPQRVLYLDFELTSRNIYERYTNLETGKSYQFDDENLKRVTINPDFLDFDQGMEKLTQSEIERHILDFKPHVLIVDNITFLTSESASDNNIAIRLMKRLLAYKRKYDMSLLVLAHTIKGINKFMMLEKRHMAGAAQLDQFADAMFGIKSSAIDSELKYLKQFKDRNQPMTLNEDNVMVLEMRKGGADYNFLSFKFNQFDREMVHIAVPENDEQAMDNMIKKAIETRIEEEAAGRKCGYGTLIKLIGWKRSKQNLINKMKDYAATSPRFEFDDEAHTYKYSDSNPF